MIIAVSLDVEIVPGKTLLVIDEIQESSNVLTSLKFFNEDLPELAVMAAGSLLGLAVGRSRETGSDEENPNEARGSFPVGKVNLLDVYPMSFSEFVRAVGKRRLARMTRAMPKWSSSFRAKGACIRLRPRPGSTRRPRA